MNNLQHFDGPTFEADVLKSAEPVVVDFWADWCPPCKMMEPAVETLAVEFAGKVKIGKLVDRMVGYPGGAAPIRAWIAKSVNVTTANK